MERHGHLDLDPVIKTKVLQVSAATIDQSQDASPRSTLSCLDWPGAARSQRTPTQKPAWPKPAATVSMTAEANAALWPIPTREVHREPAPLV